ncbi:hypothetical protein C0J52_00130, partial [Blattella germanica]
IRTIQDEQKSEKPCISDTLNQDDCQQIETQSTDSGFSTASTIPVADRHEDLDDALQHYVDGTDKLLLSDSTNNPIDAQLASLSQRLHVNQLLLDSARSRMKNVSFEAEHQRLDKLRNSSDGDILVQPSNLETDKMTLEPGIKEMKSIMADMKKVLERLQSVNLTHDNLLLHLDKEKSGLQEK